MASTLSSSTVNAGLPFRSVLPHEPLPASEAHGYLHVQGAFAPKVHKPVTSKQQREGEEDEDTVNEEAKRKVGSSFWTMKSLEEALFSLLSTCGDANNKSSRPWLRALADSSSVELQSVHVLDSTLSKVRLVYNSPLAAFRMMRLWRTQRLSPAQLFSDHWHLSRFTDQPLNSLTFSGRPLQITQITTMPLPSDDYPATCWARSNPPKFRRLLLPHQRPDGGEMFQQDRRETRFVYITNLIDPSSSSGNAALTNWKDDPLSVVEAVRSIVTPYDSSGMGVEVFVPHTNKKKPKGGKGDVTGQSCHVGMRTNTDAQALIAGLMKKQRVEWTWTDACGAYHTSLSGRLFVDYAVTADSPKQRRRQQGKRGEPTRPQCTSTTDHVHVPGLVLVPDFVSVAEEEALMAVLTGPRAPWAPSQKTASHPDEAVKRAVQHYGYVFDYETANVLRDRTQPGADCPPMPALSATLPNTDNGDGVPGHEKCTLGSIRNLDSFVNKCVDDGRGWEVFAGIVERTRRYEFRIDDGSSCVKFPRLNQLTVNQYLPGEGIGSHVDTPSAFGDGLISISLNGGIVMEFRKVDGDEGNDEAPDETKKLVYLPPRSLLLMSKAARYQWEHMIVGRRTDTHNGAVLPRHLRVSLTLRTALDVDGEPLPLIKSSRFPPTWGGVSSNTSPLVTPDCERDHVHAVYDAIATQWHHTRGRRGVLWPGATSFLQRLRPGSIVADVGCGDGKYFPAIWEAGSYVIGTDISEPLLRTTTSSGSNGPNAGKIPDARKLSEHRHHLSDRPAVAVADCLNVPIRSSSCDAAICIAVLHHLSTRSRRKRCIEELARIVKSGGLVNVQAWAMEQEEGSRHRFAADDVFVPFNAQPKYLDVSVSSSDSQAVNGTNVSVHRVDGKSVAQIYSEAFNADYDDEKGLVVFKRYCHLYREGELDEIALQVPGVELIESGFESGNYFITFMVRK